MNFFKLRNQEKNSFIRGIFLKRGLGLGLDRFYEGDKKVGFYQWYAGVPYFFCFIFLKCSGYEYVEGAKNYSDYSPNTIIVLPLLTGAYGGFLIIKKAFRLAKQFENAE